MSTGKTMQVLAAKKQKLAELTSRCKRLKADIASRTATMERLRAENQRVGGELVKDTKRADRLGVAVDESEDLPGVHDYVSLRAEHADLAKELSSWLRKVDIAEMAARKAAARATVAQRAVAAATPGAVSIMAAQSGSTVVGPAAAMAAAASGASVAVGPAGGKSGLRAMKRTGGAAAARPAQSVLRGRR